MADPEYTQFRDERPDSKSSNRRWFWGGFGASLGCGLVLILLCAGIFTFGWKPFVRFGISSDLNEIYQEIEACNLEGPERNRLLKRVDTLRRKARKADIGLLMSIDYLEAIRSITTDRQITPEELLILDRELEQLEQELTDE